MVPCHATYPNAVCIYSPITTDTFMLGVQTIFAADMAVTAVLVPLTGKRRSPSSSRAERQAVPSVLTSRTKSRKALMDLPEFRDAFAESKARIRRMEYRFVEERDQNCQALLEIYCSVVLGTPYNDFKTH